MRNRARLLLPGLVLGSLFAGFGGLLAYVAYAAPRTVPGLVQPLSVRHRVTRSMEEESAARARKRAPVFALKSYDGVPIQLGGVHLRPTFVYFVKEGCPCSYDANPFYKGLADAFKGDVDFVAVTDADEVGAKRWSTELSVPFPVVSDPKAEVMKAYNAKSSVYSALVDREGRIVKIWPGYSQSLLREMNQSLAREAGTAEKPFDTRFAPVEKAAGCAFNLPK